MSGASGVRADAARSGAARAAVIRLGLRLSWGAAREGKVRLVLTALGVALAVTLLLFTISGFNALEAKDVRSGWLDTGGANRMPSVDENRSDPLWWRLSYDLYDGRPIGLVEVAATGPASPLVPGLERLPEPGEYYVSQALARLLAETPADQLGARFSGVQAGILGDEGLASPETLMAVVGRSPAELEGSMGAVQVSSIEAAPTEHSYSEFMKVALGIGAVGLMLPVLVFVVTSTRLAAARREERLAALRLVGATPGQVNIVAAVEAVLAAIAGTLVGFALFYIFRPLVARIPFTGEPFFTGDLSLGPLAIIGVAIGVPVAAVLAGLWTLRRVQISPLGVTRKAPPKRPRPIRLLAPVVAVALLLVPALIDDSQMRTFSVVGVFAAIALSIVIVGPWLTSAGSRVLAALARRDSTLIAARRLGSDSRRAFRAISGLVLAVFIGTVFTSIIATAINSGSGTFQTPDLPASTVVQAFGESSNGYLDAGASADLVATLADVEGVQALILVLSLPASAAVPAPVYGVQTETGVDSSYFSLHAAGLVTESDWALLGGSAGSVDGSGYVAVDAERVAMGFVQAADRALIAEGTSALVLDAPLIPDASSTTKHLVVLTDGGQASIERVRTTLEVANPSEQVPYTVGEMLAVEDALLDSLRRMVDVGMVLCLVIAGCSLAVSVAGGLVERKRAFALLRLTGMPLRRLYRAVLLEAAVPLLLAAVVSAGVGFLVAALVFWNTDGGFTVATPGVGYFALLIGGLLAALAIVGATLPLVGRMTEPQTARAE
ncbi:MAG: ABC transporter permease [Thermoleophilia bacterium]|nr:ABC transporter permease [Thermoleophilia bacterium]